VRTDAYTPGYSEAIRGFMGHRTAEAHAGFFLPKLEAGWRVLDVGCGPGTITLGLARRVAPGSVVAIDVQDAQFAEARERAERDGLHVDFRQASAYQMPFPDEHFDAVFCHAVLQHLSDPRTALGEMRRVLKRGGLIGVRAGDLGGTLIDAASEDAVQAMGAYLAGRKQDGGDPYIGRKLGRLLRETGFVIESLTASYDVLTEILRTIGTAMATQFTVAGSPDGPTDSDPPFVALAWCEAIGRAQ
jgi:ubiquinone/menaquinone biosynthesis C-methylase UbiE